MKKSVECIFLVVLHLGVLWNVSEGCTCFASHLQSVLCGGGWGRYMIYFSIVMCQALSLSSDEHIYVHCFL